jgi:hypothetical protein
VDEIRGSSVLGAAWKIVSVSYPEIYPAAFCYAHTGWWNFSDPQCTKRMMENQTEEETNEPSEIITAFLPTKRPLVAVYTRCE